MITKPSLEARLMVVIGLLVGITAVFLEPPAVTFDGPSHYFRVLQISEGRIRAERFSELAMGGTLPRGHVNFINSLWRSYWVSKDFGTYSSWTALSAKWQADTTPIPVQFSNSAFYSPVNYLFQVLGVVIARLATSSPLRIHQAGCFLNVVANVVIMAVAIELMPRFRRGLLVLVTTPFILIQAASMSGDALNVSLPMLVLALAWRMRVTEVARPRFELALLLALGLVVDLLKPASFATLVCLVLIPTRYFGSMRIRIVTLAGYFLCIAALWRAWNHAYTDLDVARWFVRSMPPAAIQKVRLLTDPMIFAGAFVRLLRYDLFDQWFFLYCHVGGWISNSVYGMLRWPARLALIGLAFASHWTGRADKPWAIGMFLQASASLLVISLAMWLGFAALDPTRIIYLNGRYLFPFFGCLAIAWSEFLHRGFPRVRSALFWVALLANFAGATAILVSIGARVLG